MFGSLQKLWSAEFPKRREKCGGNNLKFEMCQKISIRSVRRKKIFHYEILGGNPFGTASQPHRSGQLLMARWHVWDMKRYCPVVHFDCLREGGRANLALVGL